MKQEQSLSCLLHLLLLLLIVYRAHAVFYDYSASIECLANPLKPQYNGGIIRNPELNNGLSGWTTFGNAAIAISTSSSGDNKFAVARSRTLPHDSVSQTLYLKRNYLYTFSAWIQVSKGEAAVSAVVKTRDGYVHAGRVLAKSACWSMLKGGLTVDASGPAKLYFESNNTSVEIWIDNVSLQPFTQEEWRSTQFQSIEKIRKEKVKVKVVDREGNPIRNATVKLQQTKPSFPFGCAINKNILGNQPYIDWFTQRFSVTTFENEMKWYSTEGVQGHEWYETADAMVNFCKQNGINIRGHNVLWDDPRYQPGWVNALSPDNLKVAAENHLNSVMTRYKGQLIHWDVMNENLHFTLYEDKLGPDASAKFYNLANLADPSPILFMNEFSTIEDSRDQISTPQKYLEKMKQIQSFPGNERIPMGIGLEGHWFTTVNLPYMRSTLDIFAATGLPIWLTEVDVHSGDGQEVNFENILREGHSHPEVKGIVLWSAWKPQGCFQMCLTDNNFVNLATGDVVDKLIREWGGLSTSVTGHTDASGFFETSLFHGDYNLQISSSHQSLNSKFTTNASTNFTLASSNSPVLEIRVT